MGSAMQHAGVMDCPMAAAMMVCCPEFITCIACYFGKKTAEKYNIVGEGMPIMLAKGCCCTCCYLYQIQNEVMVREKLKFGCAQLVPEGGAPPQVEMER